MAVEADLDVSVAGEPVTVAGDGDLLVIDAPSVAALRAFRRGIDALPGSLTPATVAGDGPTVDVRVRGIGVARIVPGEAPGFLATLLGTAPARPSLPGLLRALLGR